jgi:hypothetical protein
MGQTPQWMTFQEIAILLALEASQPDPTTARSASEILAMRRAGEAWPAIARALGCRNVDTLLETAGEPPRPSKSRPRRGRRRVA